MFKKLLAVAMLVAAASGANAATVFVPSYVTPPRVEEAQPSDYRNIRSVAVISALGENLTLRNNHFLGPQEHELDIGDWKIDAEIEARLKQYLSARFSFRQVSFEREALARISDNRLGDLFSGFSDFLEKLPTDQTDAYIVVRQGLANSAPGIEGLGLENGGTFEDGVPIVWANFEINIVDAKSKRIIARSYSRVQLRKSTPISFAGFFADQALKVGDDFNLTGAQSKLLHNTVSSLLNLSLVETLRSLNMGVDLPPPGARSLVPIPSDKNPYAGYRNVAIVSALGDSLDIEHAGFSILNHDIFPAQDPGWHVDAYIEAKARSLLSAHFSVVDPKVDRAAFSRAVLWDESAKFAPQLPGLNPDPGIDLYIVFVRLNEPVLGVYTAAGPGIFNKTSSLPEIAEGTYVFAHYAVAAIDARTMKVVFAKGAQMSPASDMSAPQRLLNAVSWPSSSPPVFPSDEMDQFHAAMNGILDESVNETLLQLLLLGVTPVEGLALPDASLAAAQDRM